MSEIYLTSDTHFCHIQSFLWEPRGFQSVEEMNETIVRRWNKVIKSGDTIWHLGDMALSDTEGAIKYIKRLHGSIQWIGGNHDSKNKIEMILSECPNVHWHGWAQMIKFKKINCFLSHYPTLTANYDNDKHFITNVINFHGHTHSQTNFIDSNNPFMYHVGMDSHECAPVHIEEAIADVRQQWNTLRFKN